MEDGLQHEDKCRVWDDSEFCDCGAREVDRLEKENARLKSALRNIIDERGEDYGDSDYQSIWKAIEEAKSVLS